MIYRETSLDRFIFTCVSCDYVWEAHYDVQHVEDGHGHERDYFFRHQLPCPDPTGLGETTCPHCGRSSVAAQLSDRRTSPAAQGIPLEEPGATTAPTHTATPATPALLLVSD